MLLLSKAGVDLSYKSFFWEFLIYTHISGLKFYISPRYTFAIISLYLLYHLLVIILLSKYGFCGTQLWWLGGRAYDQIQVGRHSCLGGFESRLGMLYPSSSSRKAMLQIPNCKTPGPLRRVYGAIPEEGWIRKK